MHCGMVTGFLKEQRSPFGRYAWLKQASFLEISNICTLFSSEAVFTTDAMHVRFETLANVARFPFTRSQKPLLTCNPSGVEFAILICDLVLRT